MIMAKKLYRSRQNHKIAGVCGGIAEYFDVDPIIIRLLALILVLSVGAGSIAYIVAWLIVPKEPENPYPAENETLNQYPVVVQ